jgi:lambda repressor-like predicted transcriptional regulator
MKFLRNRQELEHTLILMHHEGSSIRELSRQFHLGRNTVRRILRAQAHRRDDGHEVLPKLLKTDSGNPRPCRRMRIQWLG